MTCILAWQISETLRLHNIRDRNWHIQACSAKEGKGLQQGMEWLVQNVNK